MFQQRIKYATVVEINEARNSAKHPRNTAKTTFSIQFNSSPHTMCSNKNNNYNNY